MPFLSHTLCCSHGPPLAGAASAKFNQSYSTQGYVTIVPIMPDLTANNPLVFKSMLSGFAP